MPELPSGTTKSRSEAGVEDDSTESEPGSLLLHAA